MKSCVFWRKVLQLMSLKQKEWVLELLPHELCCPSETRKSPHFCPQTSLLGRNQMGSREQKRSFNGHVGRGRKCMSLMSNVPPLNPSWTLNSHLALAEGPPQQWGQTPLSCSSMSSQVQQSSPSLTCYYVTIILCEDHCISFKVSINHHWNARKWLLETTPMPTRTIINKKNNVLLRRLPPQPPITGLWQVNHSFCELQ